MNWWYTITTQLTLLKNPANQINYIRNNALQIKNLDPAEITSALHPALLLSQLMLTPYLEQTLLAWQEKQTLDTILRYVFTRGTAHHIDLTLTALSCMPTLFETFVSANTDIVKNGILKALQLSHAITITSILAALKTLPSLLYWLSTEQHTLDGQHILEHAVNTVLMQNNMESRLSVLNSLSVITHEPFWLSLKLSQLINKTEQISALPSQYHLCTSQDMVLQPTINNDQNKTDLFNYHIRKKVGVSKPLSISAPKTFLDAQDVNSLDADSHFDRFDYPLLKKLKRENESLVKTADMHQISSSVSTLRHVNKQSQINQPRLHESQQLPINKRRHITSKFVQRKSHTRRQDLSQMQKRPLHIFFIDPQFPQPLSQFHAHFEKSLDSDDNAMIIYGNNQYSLWKESSFVYNDLGRVATYTLSPELEHYIRPMIKKSERNQGIHELHLPEESCAAVKKILLSVGRFCHITKVKETKIHIMSPCPSASFFSNERYEDAALSSQNHLQFSG